MNDLYDQLSLLETIREAVADTEKTLKIVEKATKQILSQIEKYEEEMWDGY